VLTEAAINGAKDHLIGLKENVIIGKLIPSRDRCAGEHRRRSRARARRAAEEALAGESLERLRGPEYEYNPFLEEAGGHPSEETADLASLLSASVGGGHRRRTTTTSTPSWPPSAASRRMRPICRTSPISSSCWARPPRTRSRGVALGRGRGLVWRSYERAAAMPPVLSVERLVAQPTARDPSRLPLRRSLTPATDGGD